MMNFNDFIQELDNQVSANASRIQGRVAEETRREEEARMAEEARRAEETRRAYDEGSYPSEIFGEFYFQQHPVYPLPHYLVPSSSQGSVGRALPAPISSHGSVPEHLSTPVSSPGSVREPLPPQIATHGSDTEPLTPPISSHTSVTPPPIASSGSIRGPLAYPVSAHGSVGEAVSPPNSPHINGRGLVLPRIPSHPGEHLYLVQTHRAFNGRLVMEIFEVENMHAERESGQPVVN